VLAATSREFAIAVLLYGVVVAWRGGYRPWNAAALYLPALAAFGAVRIWAVTVAPPKDEAYVTVASAVANLQTWQSPLFILMFVYFMVTLYGGLTMSVLTRPVWLARVLVRRWELLVFLAPVVAAAVAGNIDIWRYLAFAFPVVVVLIGLYVQSLTGSQLQPAMIMITLVTLVTQRPLEQMNADSYFRDWFPLYERPEGLSVAWSYRIFAMIIFCGALAVLTSRPVRRSPGGGGRFSGAGLHSRSSQTVE
jgi:hypothetical protein